MLYQIAARGRAQGAWQMTWRRSQTESLRPHFGGEGSVLYRFNFQWLSGVGATHQSNTLETVRGCTWHPKNIRFYRSGTLTVVLYT